MDAWNEILKLFPGNTIWIFIVFVVAIVVLVAILMWKLFTNLLETKVKLKFELKEKDKIISEKEDDAKKLKEKNDELTVKYEESIKIQANLNEEIQELKSANAALYDANGEVLERLYSDEEDDKIYDGS